MAMIVWRVTPMRAASCACVIWPWASRSARMELVILVGLLIAAGLKAAPVGDQLDHGPGDRPQHEPEVDDVGDPEVAHLRQRQEEGGRRATHHEPAADVLAEPVDLLVPHVCAAAVAGPRGLDQG